MEILYFNIYNGIKPFENLIYFSKYFLYIYMNPIKIRSNFRNDTIFIF